MAGRNSAPSISKMKFHYDIPNISALDEDGVFSPEVRVHDIPWKVHVCNQTAEEKEMLTIILVCGEQSKPRNWSCIAHGKFKLLSFNGDQNAVAFQLTPSIFQGEQWAYSCNLIEWCDLFDASNNYVKDDAIVLEITIEVANPNDVNETELVLENIDKCCDMTGSATFRLTVNNIENLLVVRSSNIGLRNSDWIFDVCKYSGHLLVCLYNIHQSKKISCKVQLLVKVLSSKLSVKPIEQICNAKLKKSGACIETERLISWDELLKSKNGFVNNGSIVIEVKVNAGKPEGVDSNSRKRKATDPLHRKMKCVICLDEIGWEEDVSVTNCGHVFCSLCIRKDINIHKKCPLCKTPTSLDQLKRIYLPL